jgi:hypothetical protein
MENQPCKKFASVRLDARWSIAVTEGLDGHFTLFSKGSALIQLSHRDACELLHYLDRVISDRAVMGYDPSDTVNLPDADWIALLDRNGSLCLSRGMPSRYRLNARLNCLIYRLSFEAVNALYKFLSDNVVPQ